MDGMDFTDDLAVCYSDFADTLVCDGISFNGMLASSDASVYDIDVITTHTLRYPSGTVLTKGQTLTRALDGAKFRVVNIPKRINDLEYTADLVRQ